MIVIKKGRYRTKHVIGGAGIFTSIVKFLAKMLSGPATTELIISTSRDVGKKLGEKLATKVLTPKSQEIIEKYTGSAIAIEDLVKQLNGSGLKSSV